MIQAVLGDQLIGHISRDSTAIEARESIARCDFDVETAGVQETAQDNTQEDPQEKPAKPKRGRPAKGEERSAPEPSALERQRNQSFEAMMSELNLACSQGTKRDSQGFKKTWKGYKLHLDTACCGVPISAILTGANVHDSRVALPLMHLSTQRVDACYELMDAAYCSTVLREEIRAAGRVPLIDHNPRRGEKIPFLPHEAERFKTRSSAERCNARLKDEFGARHVQVRGHQKVMFHLMLGVVALCADQFTKLLL